MKKLIIIMLMVFIMLASAACAATGSAQQPEYVEAVAGGPAPLSPEDIKQMWSWVNDADSVQIIVNGEVIDAPKPFGNVEAGALMLPVVAIAEALGYTVVDNGSEVVIGPGTLLNEGVNSYARGREAAVELTCAPMIRDGVMYVPEIFFQEILSAVAYVADGTVIVESMQE